MIERNFEVEYEQPAREEETYDVSFRVNDDTEEALLNGIAERVSENATRGNFDATTIKLLRDLCNQVEKYLDDPPEGDTDYRVFDLELTAWDYFVLSEVLATRLRHRTGLGDAEEVVDLFYLWIDITEQVRIQTERKEYESLTEYIDDIPLEAEENVRYETNGVCKGPMYLRDGSRFIEYESYQGTDTWYVCDEACGKAFTNVGNEHDCSMYV